MLNNKVISVIIPVYNEERHIKKVIDTIPVFVDYIMIINDGSSDNTTSIIENLTYSKLNDDTTIPNLEKLLEYSESYLEISISNKPKDRILVINHKENRGKGSTIRTGYIISKILSIDCVATMDGDGQMDPTELINICKPVVFENIDYVKGNRFKYSNSKNIIPKTRLIGNIILSAITKPCSGYWHISDTQSGFTAISIAALKKLPLEDIYTDYGYPNDLLIKLNIQDCTIKEVTTKPIYNADQISKMKIRKVVAKIAFLLISSFFLRIYSKYFKKELHLIFIFYAFSFMSLGLFIITVFDLSIFPFIQKNITIFRIGILISSIIFLLIAMILDMIENKHLHVK